MRNVGLTHPQRLALSYDSEPSAMLRYSILSTTPLFDKGAENGSLPRTQYKWWLSARDSIFLSCHIACHLKITIGLLIYLCLGPL